jgi:hypothetical protein
MTISIDLFAIVIFAALAIVIASPLILLAFWIADLKRGALW